MDLLNFVQGQDYTLAGSGVTATATTLTLASMKYPGGVTNIVTADIGSICYAVLEPETPREENISFTTITQNADGTATLTGVVRGLAFKAPYTQDTSLRRAHSGGSLFRISNTAPFYNQLMSKQNDETILGIYTFTNPNVPRMDTAHTYLAGEQEYFATKRYVDSVAIAGASNADTTTKGIVQEATLAETLSKTAVGSTGARLFVDPVNFPNVLTKDYAISATGNDSYAITISPAITAYVDGQVFTFKADVANTGAASLAVSGLAAIDIVKLGTIALATGDIGAGSIVQVIYNASTNKMVLQTPSARPMVSQAGSEVYAATATGNDSYAVTITPAPAALVDGLTLRVKADVANTGAATLAVNGGAALAIVKGVATALETGDIVANQIFTVVYNSTGTVWQLSSPSSKTNTMVSVVPVPAVSSVVVTTASISGATQINLYSFNLPLDITVNKITINVTASAVAGTFKLGVWSEDGQTKLINVTTANIAGAAVVTTAVSSVFLRAGSYWFSILPVTTASATFSTWTSAIANLRNLAGEPTLCGYVDPAGATFTPSSIIAAENNVIFRLDN